MSTYIEEREKIKKRLNSINSEHVFSALALAVFNFQYIHNPLYQKFCKFMQRSPESVTCMDNIPFLPISFFKTHVIKTGSWKSQFIFKSSGTTGEARSAHHVNDVNEYLNNCDSGFREFFKKDPSEICFIAVLPGYQGREDSSLIHMLKHFIERSKFKISGFYLGKERELSQALDQCKKKQIPTVLFGVSFALLDLIVYDLNFPELSIIETGGMKTSKIERTKKEIIDHLKSSWKTINVHSEYGMTELFSQSYSLDGKWYKAASTKKVIVGELTDPFTTQQFFKTGILKIIDLANYDTCSFIETEDLGMADKSGKFQILGRLQNAELRGCNLLLDDALENPVG